MTIMLQDRMIVKMIGGVRNPSPAIVGSPFGSANRRVSGFGTLCLHPNSSPILRTLDSCWTSSAIGRKGVDKNE